jgi:hypothetical protein
MEVVDVGDIPGLLDGVGVGLDPAEGDDAPAVGLAEHVGALEDGLDIEAIVDVPDLLLAPRVVAGVGEPAVEDGAGPAHEGAVGELITPDEITDIVLLDILLEWRVGHGRAFAGGVQFGLGEKTAGVAAIDFLFSGGPALRRSCGPGAAGPIRPRAHWGSRDRVGCR